MKPLFTAKVKAQHGRAGHVRSDDGVLDHNIVMPNAKKDGETGTNPEQLFALVMRPASEGRLNKSPRSKVSKLNQK